MSVRPARLQLRRTFELQDFPVDAVFSPDGQQLIVGCGAGVLCRLRLADAGSPVETLGEHAGGLLSLAWQGGGQHFASSGQDGRVCLWEARNGTVRELLAGIQWVEQLAFANTGKLLAAARGREVLLFGGDGALLTTIGDHPGSVAALAWRPRTGELAAVGNGGLRLHRFEPQHQQQEFAWNGACLTASWSPDGRVLASGMQDGSVHFWRIAAGNQSQMRGYGAKVALTTWSANSRYLGTAAGETVVVWDFNGGGPEGSEPLQLRGHSARIGALAFRPAGAHLVSGGRDWRLMLWRPGTTDQAEDAHLLGAEVVLLRWSRDGRWLVAGDRQGTLSLFEFGS